MRGAAKRSVESPATLLPGFSAQWSGLVVKLAPWLCMQVQVKD